MQYKLCVGCLACLPFLDVTSFGMCLLFQIWLGFQRQDQNCLDAQRRTLCEVLNSLSKPWIPVISWSLLGGRQETKWPHWNRGNWGMVCAGVCKGLGNYSHSCIGRNGEQKAQLINELFFFFFFHIHRALPLVFWEVSAIETVSRFVLYIPYQVLELTWKVLKI